MHAELSIAIPFVCECNNWYKTIKGDERCIKRFGLKTWRDEITGKKCKWEDNTKIVLNEIVCEGVNWIYLALDIDR
jgi:hypothetical protein